MANEDHDLDLDDDLDDGLDLPDLDFDDPESDPSSREPIERVSTGFKDGLKQSSMNRSTQKKLIENALPKGYDSAFTAAYDAKDAAEDLYDTAAERLRPAVKDAKKIGRKVREKASPYLPKWLDEKLDSWTQEDQDGSRMDDYDPQENEIQTTLANIFQTQQEEKAEEKVGEETDKQTDRALADARHLDNKSQLSLIHEAIGRVVGYQEDIATKFQKKSLELQYRQYYVAKDQYSLLKEYAEQSGQSLVDIRKNTALPDFVKMRGSERVKQMLISRTLGKVGDSIGDFSRNFGSDLFENIKGRVSDFASNIADGIADMSGAMEDVGDSDVDPVEMGSGLVGEAAGGALAKHLGQFIGKYTKDNDNLARVGADLEYLTQGGTDRAAQSITSRLSSRVEELESTIEKKEFDDEKVSLRERGELNLLRNVLSLIPRFTEEGQFGMSSEQLSEEVAAYTELTDKTITETIPGLLSEILREAEMIRTGSDDVDRQVYDFDRGEVVRESHLQDDIKQKIVADGNVRGIGQKVDKIVDLLDSDKTLGNDVRAELADQIQKDIFQNKPFTVENYAKADNLDDMSSKAAKQVSDLISSRYMVDGEFKKDRKASETRRDASRSYEDAKRDIPNYKEIIARNAGAYGKGILARAGLSEYTGKDGLHKTRSASVRDLFNNLDDDHNVIRSNVQQNNRNVLDDISQSNLTGSNPVEKPTSTEDTSRFSNLIEGAKQLVEPYLQVLWETMDESKAFIEGIYDFLIERFDGNDDPPGPSGPSGGGGSPWNRPIWGGPSGPSGPSSGPSGGSSWDRPIWGGSGGGGSSWNRNVGDFSPKSSSWNRPVEAGFVGFSESNYNPNESGLGEKLGSMAGGLFSKAKDRTKGLRSQLSEYGTKAKGRLDDVRSEATSTYGRYKDADDRLGMFKGDMSKVGGQVRGRFDTARDSLAKRYDGSTLQKYVGVAQDKFDKVTSDVNKILLDNGIDVVKLSEQGSDYIDGLYADAKAKGQPYVDDLNKRLEALDTFSKEAMKTLSDKEARTKTYEDVRDELLDKLSDTKDDAMEATSAIYAQLKTEQGRAAISEELHHRADRLKDDLTGRVESKYDEISERVKGSEAYKKMQPHLETAKGQYTQARDAVTGSEVFKSIQPHFSSLSKEISSLTSAIQGKFGKDKMSLPKIDLSRESVQDSLTDLKNSANSKVENIRQYFIDRFGNDEGLVDELMTQIDESDINEQGAEDVVNTTRFKATFDRLLKSGKGLLSGGDKSPAGNVPPGGDGDVSRGNNHYSDDEPYRPWLDELKEHLDVKTDILVQAMATISSGDGKQGSGIFSKLLSGAGKMGGGLMNYYGKTFKGIGSLLGGAGKGVGNLLGGLFGRKKSDGPEVSDIYYQGIEEPIILARDLKRGRYADFNTGEPIYSFDDIDGPIVDDDGNIVITQEDVDEKRVYVNTDNGPSFLGNLLGSGASLLGKGLKGLFGGYWNIARGIQKGVFSGAKKVAGVLPGLLFGKEKKKSASDVYVKGESEPRLRAVIMKTGGYLSAETEEPVRTIQDIDGEILDHEGNIVLSHADIKQGLVDAKGNPLDLSTGRSGGLIKGALGLARKGMGLSFGLAKGAFGASKRILTGAKDMVGGLFGGGGKASEKLESNSDQQVTLLTEIRDLINERVNPPRDFLDGDDDGMRDGGWRSKLYGDKSKSEKDDKSDKDKDGFANKDKSLLASLGSMFGGGDGDGEEGDDYSYVDVGGDGDDKDKKNKKNKNTRKPKGRLGKMWQGAKNIGSKAGRFLGLGKAGGWLSKAGGLLRSGAGWAARGLWMLGSAAVSLVGAPVALAIGAAVAVGVGAYFLYKWADQADLDDINRARYTQYGADLENKEHVGMMYKLENFFEDYVSMPKGQPPTLKDVDPEDLLDEVGLDPEENEEQIERFYQWLQDRFKPVYLTWIATAQPYMDDFDIEDAEDQLEVKQKVEVLKKSKFEDSPESPYRKMTSPFKEKSGIVGFSQVDKVYNEVLEKLESQLDEDETESSDDTSTETSDKPTHTADELKSMTQAERIRAAASRTNNVSIKNRLLAKANQLEKKQGAKTSLAATAMGAGAGSVTLELSDILELPDTSLVSDPVGKTRMVAYGVQSPEDTDKVQHLLELEKVVKPMTTISNGKATFKGSVTKLYDQYSSLFGRDIESDQDRMIWTEWFNKRFIPVLATYMGHINKRKGSFYNPMSLKDNGPYEVASKVRSAVNGAQMSVWTVQMSPWPDYRLSNNSSQVRSFLGELLTTKPSNPKPPVDKGRDDFGRDDSDKDIGRLGGEKADNYRSDGELFKRFESPGVDEQEIDEAVDKDVEDTSSKTTDPQEIAERKLGMAESLRESAERQTNERIKRKMLKKADQLERSAKNAAPDVELRPKRVDADPRDERASQARQALDKDVRRRERVVASTAAQNNMHTAKLTDNTNRMVSILNQSVGVQRSMADHLSDISQYLRDQQSNSEQGKSTDQKKQSEKKEPKQRTTTSRNGDVQPAVNMKR